MEIPAFSLLGPLVSLLGAAVSWYWARKRIRWDAGRELGVFRADTIQLLRNALLVTNPTWRHLELRKFASDHAKWKRSLDKHAAIFSRAVYGKMNKLDQILDEMTENVLGMPLGGLAAQEAMWERDIDRELNDMDDRIYSEVSRFLEAIKSDPRYFH